MLREGVLGTGNDELLGQKCLPQADGVARLGESNPGKRLVMFN